MSDTSPDIRPDFQDMMAQTARNLTLRGPHLTEIVTYLEDLNERLRPAGAITLSFEEFNPETQCEVVVKIKGPAFRVEAVRDIIRERGEINGLEVI